MLGRLALVLALTVGCEAGSSTDPARPMPVTKPVVAPMPDAASVAPLATASNQLGFDLWTKVRVQPGNLAVSPASISTALAMAWSGARGATATQMQQTMHLAGDPASITTGWGKLAAGLQSPDRPIALRIANRLFGEKTYTFEAAYLAATKQAFGAPLEPVDFKGAPEPTRERINRWVADQTEQRIKNLLGPGTVKSTSRLVLVNAIYFLGDWLAPFEKEATRDAPFYASPTASKMVRTMHDMAHYRFAQLDGVAMAAIPYKGNDAFMLVVVPEARDGLPAVERSLTAPRLASWLGALKDEAVFIRLPKFTIDPKEPLVLGAHLHDLGMTDAFTPGAADFSGIAKPANPGERLVISDVIHKAFVKVDEKGTEAAAATAVMMEGVGAVRMEPKQLTADHPFLFFIIDGATNLVLFMGRVADPA